MRLIIHLIFFVLFLLPYQHFAANEGCGILSPKDNNALLYINTFIFFPVFSDSVQRQSN